MQPSIPIHNLIEHAKLTSTVGKTRYYTIVATLITPDAHIETYLPSGFARDCMFALNRTDDYRIAVQIQPGLYQTKVLPYRDNLYMEVIMREGLKQRVKKFRCIVTTTSNPEISANNTKVGDLTAVDHLNLVTIEFQLQEPGFAILKNVMVGRTPIMATLDKVLYNEYITAGAELGLTGADAFRGVDIVKPIDNDQSYTHISVPDGIRLMDLAGYLQNDDRYGIYSRGLGMYYRKGMVYVYPLFLFGRYKSAPKVVDIYRLPEDVFPTLESTFYTSDRTLTILSTGEGKYENKSDFKHQNDGVGTRLLNPDALTNKVGYFYENGVAITTRSDTLSEFKTTDRGSNEEIIKFDPNPSSNICKALSNNAMNDGQFISVPWDASDIDLIVPGMPCKYYYTARNETIAIKEGIILGARSKSVRNSPGDINGVFRESSTLVLFIPKTDA